MKEKLNIVSVSLEVNDIIEKLKSGELEVEKVPEEFALDFNIVKVERELGLRKSGYRVFDVITQEFFVEEQWLHKDFVGDLIPKSHKMSFDSFREYYNFLDGESS